MGMGRIASLVLGMLRWGHLIFQKTCQEGSWALELHGSGLS